MWSKTKDEENISIKSTKWLIICIYVYHICIYGHIYSIYECTLYVFILWQTYNTTKTASAAVGFHICDRVVFSLSVWDADGNAAVSRQRPERDDDHDPQVRHFILSVRSHPIAAQQLLLQLTAHPRRRRERRRETVLPPPSQPRGKWRIHFRPDKVQHSGGRGGEIREMDSSVLIAI